MKKLFYSLILTILWLTFAFSKVNYEEEGLSVVKTKEGFLFIFNQKDESFLLEIKGKKFLDVESEELIFSIDGQIIQFTIVPVGVFLSAVDSADTLLQHFRFEMHHIKSILGTSFKNIKPQRITLEEGKNCLLWEFDVPEAREDSSNEKVVKQIFATTKSSANVIMLSSPLTRNDEVSNSKNRLVQAFASFVFKQGLFDIQSIRDSLATDTIPQN